MTGTAQRAREMEALLGKAVDTMMEASEECLSCGAPLELDPCWVRYAEEILGRTTKANGRKHP